MHRTNTGRWELDREEERREAEKKKKFEDEHCMYSSGEEIGPPGCCLRPKLFGRACEEHLSVSLAEVRAIGKEILKNNWKFTKGAAKAFDEKMIDTIIASVLR
jgi:hypothetical protein